MKIEAVTVLSAFVIVTSARGAKAQEPWVTHDGQSAVVPPPVPGTVDTTYATTGDTGVGNSDKLDHYVMPVRKAVELQIGAGYGQGLGDVGGHLPTMSDLSGPGGTVQAAIGYRFTPHFLLGVYGTGSEFSRGDLSAAGTELRSATAGLEADFHFRPSYAIDPWLSLSSGMRGLWIAPDHGANTSLLGLELARVELGADFRMTRGVAVAPVVGGDTSNLSESRRAGRVHLFERRRPAGQLLPLRWVAGALQRRRPVPRNGRRERVERIKRVLTDESRGPKAGATSSRPAWRPRGAGVLRWAAAGAVGVGLAFVVGAVSFARVAQVLRGARMELLLATVPLLALNIVCRGLRFTELLDRAPHASVPRSGFVAAVLLNHAANNVLPLRAGDFVRTRYFTSRGYSVLPVAFAQLIEKAVEGTSLVACTAPVLATAIHHGRLSFVMLGVAVLGLPILIWLIRRGLRAMQEARFASRRPLRWPRRAAVLRAFVWSILADALDVALIYFCARSLGIESDLRGCLVVYAAVNVAIAIPSTPAHFGALEAGASLGFIALGVSREGSLAFALLYRVVQWVPVTGAGAVVWIWQHFGRREAHLGES